MPCVNIYSFDPEQPGEFVEHPPFGVGRKCPLTLPVGELAADRGVGLRPEAVTPALCAAKWKFGCCQQGSLHMRGLCAAQRSVLMCGDKEDRACQILSIWSLGFGFF